MNPTRMATWSCALLSLVVGLMPQISAHAANQTEWTFDADRIGAPPSGFSFRVTGTGRPGQWLVQEDRGTPGGQRVLAQLDSDTADYRFPMAVAEGPDLRDLRLTVRCKMVAGHVDQACGVVFRYQDEQRYYVTRANALEGNVRLYQVVQGVRRQLAGWSGAVTTGEWHTLAVEARGVQLQIFWDDQRVIDSQDKTLPQAGKIGLWTKADSVTYFDDLRVESLEP